MLLNFADISHDIYDKVERPTLVIKTPDGRIISTISNYHSLKTTFRFNDLSEVTFIVPAENEGIHNNGYDEIIGMRKIEVEPFGDFILINPKTSHTSDGKEYKECTAYSEEYAFNYKKIEIATGTYNFYNSVDNEDTIMQAIIELMPDWSIGTIDRDLIGRWRTFDTVDDNLYSFMINTLQESYNCLFLFDTFNKKINVMSASNEVSNLPIYLSYTNLLKSVEITELTEEIVTALSGYGSGDDVTIQMLNPNGTNTIYNLDYFIGTGDISDELAERWEQYQSTLAFYQDVFSNFNVLYYQKINEQYLANAELTVLQTEYDALNTAYLTAQTQKGQNEEYDENIDEMYNELMSKKDEIEAQKKYVDILTSDADAINEQINQIIGICKLDSFFTEDELKVLSQYFKQDSITEDTFVVPEYSSAILGDNSSTLTTESKATLKITNTEIFASNIAEVLTPTSDGTYSAYETDEDSGEKMLSVGDLEIFQGLESIENIAETVANQLNEEIKRKMYEFHGGDFELTYVVDDETVNVSGEVVNVNLHYNKENLDSYDETNPQDISKAGYFILSATLQNAKYNNTDYPNMNVSLQGVISNGVPRFGDTFVAFDIDNGIFYNTASVTEYQKQGVIQELYDYVEDSLDKLSTPSYEFSVESGNFVFAKEFEPFKNSLELGCTVNLALDEGETKIIKPILVELTLNYDDESDFSITFSNKYRSSSSEFKLADLITDMSRTSHSTEINKVNYSAYRDSKAGDQVANLTNSAIDVVKNNIINSKNQAIEWNGSGMFFREQLDNGEFDPKQVGIVNKNIGFTKDGWKTVDVAIGTYDDPNTGESYGVIAPNIVGTLLAGENLVIENKVLNEDGTSINKQFKVDSTGAFLNNASFVLSHDKDPDGTYAGGQIFIDPRYGIGAGDLDLYELDGTDMKPNFVDDNGDIVWDESKKIETEDGSVYYVPQHSKFFLDIKTGNAYFSGDINAQNIIAGTLNGEKITDGTLSGEKIADGTVNASSKLTGDVSADQIYKNVIEAINNYVKFTEENGETVAKMDNAVIDNLTADNFEGNTIEANSISAENLSSSVIEAINLSTSKIDANKITTDGLDANRIVVESTNSKMLIDPKYGIAVGNTSLFITTEDPTTGKLVVSPSFADSDGKLIIDTDTGTPVNSTFFFDINTGKSYFAGEISAKQITSGKLSSDYLDVKDGYITNGMIENLDAGKITSGDISAERLKANTISAINATVGTATIDSAKIENLDSNYGKITTLESDLVNTNKAVADNLEATNASISTLTSNLVTTDALVAKKADIDFANVNNGWIENGTIKNGAISDAMINDLSANKLTTGTIDANKITVTNLNADNLTVGTINGKMIGNKTIDLTSLSEEVPTKEYLDSVEEKLQGEIDGAIETFTITDVPTLNNEPASGWTTDDTRKTHIGDLCYVVNSELTQDGYCYRFAEVNGIYEWVLIKDSDVTKAIKDVADLGGTVENFKTEYSTKTTELADGISTLKTQTTSIETNLSNNYLTETETNEAISSSASSTLSSANSYADSTAETKASSAASGALSDAKKYADSTADTKANNALSSAKSYADSTAETKASSALSDAKSYTDDKAATLQSNKVDKTTFQETVDTVSEQSSTITELTKKVDAKANSSKVTTLENTVNEVKQTANTNTSNISNLTTTVADNKTAIENRASKIEQDLSGFKTTVSETYATSADVKNMKIGDRNLLLNSGESITTSSYNMHSYYFGDEKPIAGEKYTIVIKAKMGTGKTYFGFYNSGGNICVTTIYPTTEGYTDSVIYSSTFTWANTNSSGTITALNTYLVVYHMYSAVTAESTIEWIKLVKGDKTSLEWTPAPEDLTNLVSTTKSEISQTTDAIELSVSNLSSETAKKFNGETSTKLSDNITSLTTDLNGIKTRVTNTETTQDGLKTRIETAESSIEQNADKISWMVKSGDSASNFTLTDRSAELVANKINISGLVSFSGLNADAQNTITQTAQDKADAALADANIYSDNIEKTVSSLSMNNLITNGFATENSNYNFEDWIFDGSEVYDGNASFKKVGNYDDVWLGSKGISIDTSKTYEFSMNLKGTASEVIYLGWAEYDADHKWIAPEYHYAFEDTTTTLAQDLNDGDEYVYLTSVNAWHNTTATHQLGLIFWNYKDSSGYQYPEGVYSRNAWMNLYTYANVDKTNNKIKLNKPWSKGTFAAGTKVSQSNSGGYKYVNYINSNPPSDWAKTSFTIKGIQSNYTRDITKFNSAAKYVRFVLLHNYGSSAGSDAVTYVNNVRFSDVSVKKEVDTLSSLTAVEENKTYIDGSKIYTGDIDAWKISADSIKANTLTVDQINMNNLQTNIAYIGDKNKEHVIINDSSIDIKNSTTTLASYGDTTIIGKSSGQHVLIDSDSIDVMNGTTALASFGEITTIGSTNEAHLEQTSSQMLLKDKNQNTIFAVGGLTTGTETEVSEIFTFTLWDENTDEYETERNFATSLTPNTSTQSIDVYVNDLRVVEGITINGNNVKFDLTGLAYKAIENGSSTKQRYLANGDEIKLVYYTQDPLYSYTLGRRKDNTTIGINSNAEGYSEASALYSHAEGVSTASGMYAHSESSSTASGNFSHAEGVTGHGYGATGKTSHSEGYNSTASGNFSHAQNYYTTASGIGSHAEGGSTNSSGSYSHAEGRYTRASGIGSHAEGCNTNSSGSYSHTEGSGTTASARYSHTEGDYTTASGYCSHAEGFLTVAQGEYQHVFGKINLKDTKNEYVEIVGNGTRTDDVYTSSNARTLDWSGNEVLAGTLDCQGVTISGDPLFKIQEQIVKNQTIPASGAFTLSATITALTGYTPIGIAGFAAVTGTTSGKNVSNIAVRGAGISNNEKLYCNGKNTGSAAAKIDIKWFVLFIRSELNPIRVSESATISSSNYTLST